MNHVPDFHGYAKLALKIAVLSILINLGMVGVWYYQWTQTNQLHHLLQKQEVETSKQSPIYL